MKRVLYSILVLALFPYSVLAQACPQGFNLVTFIPDEQVQIFACIEDEADINGQNVFWGVRNLTSDKLYIEFTKVVYTKCGNEIREKASTHLNPGEFIAGSTFAGESTFETQIWKEDCNLPKKRIDKVDYENLIVNNISQREREKAERERIEQERREIEIAEQQKKEQERIAKEKLEKEKREQENSKKSTEKVSSKDEDVSGTDTDSSTSYYYVESDYAREQRIRGETQRERDNAEDAAMGSLMGTVGGGMAALALAGDDWSSDASIYLKGTLGLGLQQIPITGNTTYQNSNNGSVINNVSMPASTNHFSVNAGLLFAVLNDNFVSFRASPFFTYGMNAFDSGVSGNHVSYGSGLAIAAGRQLKFLLKGEYAWRSGDITEDAAAWGGNWFGSSNYNYVTLKYGAGLYIAFDEEEMGSIEVSGYRENISFLDNINAEVYSYEARLSFGILAFAVQYAPNYPIAGEVKYPGNYKTEKESLLLLTMYVPFTIFSDY